MNVKSIIDMHIKFRNTELKHDEIAVLDNGIAIDLTSEQKEILNIKIFKYFYKQKWEKRYNQWSKFVSVLKSNKKNSVSYVNDTGNIEIQGFIKNYKGNHYIVFVKINSGKKSYHIEKFDIDSNTAF